MYVIIILLAIIFSTFLLNVLIKQSYNLVFFFLKKPLAWALFMGILSFFYFFIGSKFDDSLNIIWWSAFFAFIINIPSKVKTGDNLNKMETKKALDEIYKEWGIKNGGLKYRIGLAAYVIGMILGWVIFYGQITAMS